MDVAFSIMADKAAGLIKLACFKNRLGPEFALTLRPELETQGDFVVTDSPAVSRHAEDVARLRALIAAHPGLSQRQLIERSGVPERRVPELLRQHAGRLWKVESGGRGSFCYFPLDEEEGSGQDVGQQTIQ